MISQIIEQECIGRGNEQIWSARQAILTSKAIIERPACSGTIPRNPAGAVTAYAQYLDPGGDLISTTNTERVIKSFFAGRNAYEERIRGGLPRSAHCLYSGVKKGAFRGGQISMQDASLRSIHAGRTSCRY